MKLTQHKLYKLSFIAFLLIILAVPLMVHSNYYLGILNIIGIYTMLAIGLNILMGYAGQISLGHAAFFGIGAYVTAILTGYNLTDKFGLPPAAAAFFGNHLVAAFLAVILTGLIALFLAIPTLKLHGHYLAMATLGFGIIVYMVLKQEDKITMGIDGFTGIPTLNLFGLDFDKTWHIGNIEIHREKNFFYLIWACTISLLVLSHNLINSRTGRALRSLHTSETAAETLGVNVPKYKIKVFVLSAIYSSIAGSLYAHYMNFISPGCFNFMFSIKLVTMVIIGGIASIWGAVFGAFVLTMLPYMLGHVTSFFETHLHFIAKNIKSPQDLEIIIFGLIMVVVMIFLPQGLTRGVYDIFMYTINRSKFKEMSEKEKQK